MRKVLEIGGGTTPYFVRFDIPWKDGASYTCLDMSPKRIEQAKDAVSRHREQGKSHPLDATYMVHDAVTLPLGDADADEIVLSNVLSAPIHRNWSEKGDFVKLEGLTGPFTRPIAGTPHEGDRFYRERKPVVREALRVLKPGGTLTIYTDLLVYGQHSYERLVEELKRDMSLVHADDEAEAKRIDALNEAKKATGDFCYCFDADVLPRSSVLRFRKIY